MIEDYETTSAKLLSEYAVLISNIYEKAKKGKTRTEGHHCKATSECQAIIDLIDNKMKYGK